MFRKKISQSKIDSAGGYVDIKMYEYNDNRSDKKLIYHDTGDNTVTDWMRQAIVKLLTGYSLSDSGNDNFNENNTDESREISMAVDGSHDEGKNLDGCVFSDTNAKYLQSWEGSYRRKILQYHDMSDDKYKYAIFPTKVLFGTGCEYTDWSVLESANSITNSDWFAEKKEWYGEDGALFNGIRDNVLNWYSATVGTANNYTGSGQIIKAVTVNAPDLTGLEDTPADLSKRYGVVGAIKTLYLPKNSEDADAQNYLNSVTTEAGKLLKPRYRGAGLPCFIYFNRPLTTNNEPDWDKAASSISLSKDSQKPYLNHITFRIVMPAQSYGEYYPYNGWQLKQLGLFNDSILSLSPGDETNTKGMNMKGGTMLAVKNISPFTKEAAREVVLTWTLTI